MKKLFLLALVSILLGCGQQIKQTTRDNPKCTVYVTPVGDKIIFLEDYYRLYLKSIKTDYKNRNRIYEENVQDSIFSNYFLKSEYSEWVKNKLSTPIRDTAGLGKYISEIANNHSKIEEIITTALATGKQYLKNDSITVYVLPSNNDIQKLIQGMGGADGFTAGSKQIVVSIDTGINLWKEALPYRIVREFNHTYWTKMNFNKSYRPTLLDCIVSEGRADSYAHLIYPSIKCPWVTVLSEKVESAMWNRIKSQLKNKDIAFQYHVMFGAGSQSPYTLWGGFTLGYDIVQSVLKKHPELTPAEWTTLAPEKILEMSSYK